MNPSDLSIRLLSSVHFKPLKEAHQKPFHIIRTGGVVQRQAIPLSQPFSSLRLTLEPEISAGAQRGQCKVGKIVNSDQIALIYDAITHSSCMGEIRAICGQGLWVCTHIVYGDSRDGTN
eukprot:scaffold337069_cov22-Prasinocladus_malaysianus.AAC.1